MPAYYIISQSGLLKRYYSEQNSDSINPNEKNIIFSGSLRNAKDFKTLDEATKFLLDENLTDCFIIDQNGILQKQN